MDRTSDLRSELDGFLAEVDAIKSEGLAFFDQAPSCEWIVQVDPVTRLSVYQHLPSGQTKPEMPEEYRRYLSQFDQFLKQQQQRQSTQPDEHSEQSERLSALDEALSIRVHKRKHPLPDEGIADTTSASSLHELLGYSDSSGTETDVNDGLNARQRRRMKRAHRRHAFTDGPINDPTQSSTSEQSNFIGPLLPRSVQDSAQELASAVCEPTHPPSTTMQHTRSDSPGVPGLIYTQHPHGVEKQIITDSVQVLFDQFACFNVALPEIAKLHVLFIQLSTRLEDWRSGNLSSEYFMQKIHDLAAELSPIITRGLPPNWTCLWDSDKSRFCYQNNATGHTQCEPPVTKEFHCSINSKADYAEEIQINPGSVEVEVFSGPQTRVTHDRTSPTTYLAGHTVPGDCLISDDAAVKHDSASERQPMVNPVSTGGLASAPPPLLDSSVTALDDRLTDHLDFGDRTEHLKAQLREFEEVCRALEYLDASSVTTQDDDRQAIPPDCVAGEEVKSEKAKPRDKPAKTLPSNPLSGSKGLPGLMRKWQQLQESL